MVSVRRRWRQGARRVFAFLDARLVYNRWSIAAHAEYQVRGLREGFSVVYVESESAQLVNNKEQRKVCLNIGLAVGLTVINFNNSIRLIQVLLADSRERASCALIILPSSSNEKSFTVLCF
jgi:hypothetical protein